MSWTQSRGAAWAALLEFADGERRRGPAISKQKQTQRTTAVKRVLVARPEVTGGGDAANRGGGRIWRRWRRRAKARLRHVLGFYQSTRQGKPNGDLGLAGGSPEQAGDVEVAVGVGEDDGASSPSMWPEIEGGE